MPVVAEPHLRGVGAACVVHVARAEEVHDATQVGVAIDVAHPEPTWQRHRPNRSKMCDSRTTSIPADRYNPTAPVAFSVSTLRVALVKPAAAMSTTAVRRRALAIPLPRCGSRTPTLALSPAARPPTQGSSPTTAPSRSPRSTRSGSQSSDRYHSPPHGSNGLGTGP